MAEPRDLPDALREAVERTVQATVDTRERAQGAASELSASVDELVKGAEKGLTRSRRSVRAAVGERLPATQDDIKAIRMELQRIGRRLDGIEERLPPKPRTKTAGTARKPAAAKPGAKSDAGAGRTPAAKAKAGAKSGAGAGRRPAARAKSGGTGSKPKR